jgi:hypothetical protein
LGDSPATSAGARVRWFCDNLVTGGADQYGDTYAYTITAEIKSRFLGRTYGDAGTTVITRAGGANWPTILTNKDLYYIKTTQMGWFFLLQHGKKNIKYLGLEQLSKLYKQAQQ